jgi:hypothetical protein
MAEKAGWDGKNLVDRKKFSQIIKDYILLLTVFPLNYFLVSTSQEIFYFIRWDILWPYN